MFECLQDRVQFRSRDATERTQQVGKLLEQWREAGKFECLAGWRNETYAVVSQFVGRRESQQPQQQQPFLTLERAGVGIFGFQSFGVHVNGFVRGEGGEGGQLRLWIARRSPNKATWPNYLDNFVGGGLAAGLSVRETLIKECGEEAGVPRELCEERAAAVGGVRYFQELKRGLYPESLFVYDLEVSTDFAPVCVDGEVAEFKLWGVEEVVRRIAIEEFQPESAVVTIDFLIRHGFITAENEPNYLEIVSGMRRQLF